MTRPRTLALLLLVSFTSLVCTLLVIEVVLALVKINTKANLRYIPQKGTTHIPHVYYRHTKEGYSEGYFNGHGFRDYERTYEKPLNTFRILVLGDSYTEALQVALQDSFATLLEKKLNASSVSLRYEVLNLGQSGFGTAESYMRYVNFGVQYQPDLVLLAFLTGNDIRDNSKILNREHPGFYFVLDQDQNLVLDRSLLDAYERSLTLPKRIFQFITQRSYLASFVSERVYLLRHQMHERQVQKSLQESRSERSPTKLDELSDLNIYVPDMSARWREAFTITTNLLRKFKENVEANGSRFLLVTLSNAVQVHPQVEQQVREHYKMNFDFNQPDRIIEEFGHVEHITCLKLLPAFRDYHRRTGTYLHGFGSVLDGHWNEHGHRLAAEKIFEFVRDQQLVPLNSAL